MTPPQEKQRSTTPSSAPKAALPLNANLTTIQNKVRKPRKFPCKHDRHQLMVSAHVTYHIPVSTVAQPILGGLKTKVQFTSLQQQGAQGGLSRNVHSTPAPSCRRTNVVPHVHSPQRLRQSKGWVLEVCNSTVLRGPSPHDQFLSRRIGRSTRCISLWRLFSSTRSWPCCFHLDDGRRLKMSTFHSLGALVDSWTKLRASLRPQAVVPIYCLPRSWCR